MGQIKPSKDTGVSKLKTKKKLAGKKAKPAKKDMVPVPAAETNLPLKKS